MPINAISKDLESVGGGVVSAEKVAAFTGSIEGAFRGSIESAFTIISDP